MRPIFILFAIAAMIWSGVHAGPAAAHGEDTAVWSDGVSHSHGPGHDGENDQDDESSPDLHHHCPPCAAPEGPQAELNRIFTSQIMVASATSLLLGDPRAPPFDPPIA